MVNDTASVPPRVNVSALLSGSVALTTLPMLMSVPTFSAMERVVVFPSAKTGASFTSVTLMVTVIVSVELPSEATTTTT